MLATVMPAAFVNSPAKGHPMTLGGLLSRLFGGRDSGHDVDELARRLGMSAGELRGIQPAYHEFTIAKRGGGRRNICAPTPEFKEIQKRIHRRLLKRLRAHPHATGFERTHSIVSHAAHHAGRAVVVRIDLVDFFPTTTAKRVRDYFRNIGWNREAADLLTRLCTHDNCLPQGAPTSPRLSNLVNIKMDAVLTTMADRHGAAYSRYADDLTFSFEFDHPAQVRDLIAQTRGIAAVFGYRTHGRRKTRVLRPHQRQVVTGLVVNERVNLPRATRRWLRAVEHRLKRGGDASITPAQLAGWRALQIMVDRAPPPPA